MCAPARARACVILLICRSSLQLNFHMASFVVCNCCSPSYLFFNFFNFIYWRFRAAGKGVENSYLLMQNFLPRSDQSLCGTAMKLSVCMQSNMFTFLKKTKTNQIHLYGCYCSPFLFSFPVQSIPSADLLVRFALCPSDYRVRDFAP